ncbi:MAG: hypothetical protein IH944_00990 [Armatimonadetes bacterium]|nr:hypothetical protein [Armatimonadota bacterium]
MRVLALASALLLLSLLLAKASEHQKLPKLEDIRIMGIGLGMSSGRVVATLGQPDWKYSDRPNDSIAGSKDATAAWAIGNNILYIFFKDGQVSKIYASGDAPTRDNNVASVADNPSTLDDYGPYKVADWDYKGQSERRYYLSNRLKYRLGPDLSEHGIWSVTVSYEDLRKQDKVEDEEREKRAEAEAKERKKREEEEVARSLPAYKLVILGKAVRDTTNGLGEIISSHATGIIKNERSEIVDVRVWFIQYLDGEFANAKDELLKGIYPGDSRIFEITIEWSAGTNGEVTNAIKLSVVNPDGAEKHK